MQQSTNHHIRTQLQRLLYVYIGDTVLADTVYIYVKFVGCIITTMFIEFELNFSH